MKNLIAFLVLLLITGQTFAADDYVEKLVLKNLKNSNDKKILLSSYKYMSSCESNNKELWKALLASIKDYETVNMFRKNKILENLKKSNFYIDENETPEYFTLLKALMSGRSVKLLDTLQVLPETKCDKDYNHKHSTEPLLIAAMRFRKAPCQKTVDFLKNVATNEELKRKNHAPNLAHQVLASYGTKESAEALIKMESAWALKRYRFKFENTKALYKIIVEGKMSYGGLESTFGVFLDEKAWTEGRKYVKIPPYNPTSKTEAEEMIKMFSSMIKLRYKPPTEKEKDRFRKIIGELEKKKKDFFQ